MLRARSTHELGARGQHLVEIADLLLLGIGRLFLCFLRVQDLLRDLRKALVKLVDASLLLELVQKQGVDEFSSLCDLFGKFRSEVKVGRMA